MGGSKYEKQSDHDLLVLVADSNDRQERHLERINGTLQNHERRLMTQEIRREVEEETGYSAPSRRKKLRDGGIYGGTSALIISIIFGIGRAAGWW